VLSLWLESVLIGHVGDSVGLSVVPRVAVGSGHLQGILLGTQVLEGAMLLLLGTVARLELEAIIIGVHIRLQKQNKMEIEKNI